MKKASSANRQTTCKQSMKELTSLPNIGKVLADRLIEVEIRTIKELKTVGSENAFIRLQTVDESACINELMALEGAIQDIRWHNLEETRKAELKIFYQLTKLNK